MTFNDYNQSLLHLVNEYNLSDSHNMTNNHIHLLTVPKVIPVIPEPKKSIFKKFYETCRNKSETFCIACFIQVVEYCKE